MSEKNTWLVARIILGIVVLCFTMFGFIVKQECDIDKVYLWCRLHPLSLGDILGLILFYGSATFLSGLLPFQLWNEENSTKWNWVLFGVLVLSIVLIWNT